jgi:membrane protease YdiL (CAAX protease family)
MAKKEVKSDKTGGAILLSILILIVSQIGAEIIASLFMVIKVPEFICNILAGILYVFFSYKLLKLLCTKYLKSNLEDYYITKFKVKWYWIVIGLLLPLIVTGVYLLLISGSYQTVSSSLFKKLSFITAGIFYTGIGAGFVEEMVFRGIIMRSLEKHYNRAIAIIAPSLLFGIVHILGMKFNLLSCILVIIAGTMVGIMFSLITQEQKTIWNSAIVHTIWNIIIIGGILTISNQASEYTLFNYVLKSKSFLLTGGEFGIESSIIAVVGYIVVGLIAFILLKKKVKNKQI